MKKTQIYAIVLTAVILSLLANILFGRFLAAEISTVPLLNRWKILSPLAPIVINTKEEVRMDDTTDLLKVISLARPKLSGIVTVTGGQVSLVGGAENLTSDGLFISSKKALIGAKPENLYIKLDDGTLAPITASFADPATNLVILKAQLNNVPVASLGSSAGLTAGTRIVFLAPTEKNYSPSFQAGFIAREQNSDFSSVFDSDKPARAFVTQSTGVLIPGQAIANLNGELMGIWDGNDIISSDVIKDYVNGFLGNGNKVVRPDFGFQYRNVSAAEAKLTSVPVGAKAVKVFVGGVAQKAGLLADDVITAVNDSQLTADSPLEGYLAKFKPGDSVKFTVMRGKNQINLNLTAGELK